MEKELLQKANILRNEIESTQKSLDWLVGCEVRQVDLCGLGEAAATEDCPMGRRRSTHTVLLHLSDSMIEDYPREFELERRALTEKFVKALHKTFEREIATRRREFAEL